MTGDHGHLQQAALTVHGARGTVAALAEIPLPARYLDVPELAGLLRSPAYNVGAQYVQIHADLTQGTALAPDFTHAARRRRLLDAIERSGDSGTRVRL